MKSSFNGPRRRGSGNSSNVRGGTMVRHFGGGGGRKSGRNGAAYIHPSKFVNKATPVQEEAPYVPTHQFADFALLDGLKERLERRGYTSPTAVQDGAIPLILEGRDVIGLANTGTGKTAAFMLPTINRLKTDLQGRTALIIAPTRELAQQIDGEFRKFSDGAGLLSAVCVGGMNIMRQISALRRRPEVVIGTPGRLKDLFNRGDLRLDRVSVLVLDEADHMLDMGFLPDIRFLLAKLPEQRQSLCFSATITPEIQRLMDDMLDNPATISVRTRETSEHIEQDVIQATGKDEKLAKLVELLGQPGYDRVLIFGDTKFGVQRLADTLSKDGFPSEAIHGNKSQPQRQRALEAFKAGRVNVLVATDVAARGLDIPNVSHVINFDQPKQYEDYIHRIGRTGRAGKRGVALTFVDRHSN